MNAAICARLFAIAAGGLCALLPLGAEGQIQPLSVATSSQRVVAGPPSIRPGEVLRYVARVPRFRANGVAEMKVTREPDGLVRLAFDLTARVMAVRVEDRTRSWIDPGTFSSRRYTKTERSPLGSRDQSITIDPREGRWRDAGGGGGELASAEPLDELSFLYFLRTLPLDQTGTRVFHRHYDARRNPVEVEVLGRERVAVPAGIFDVVVLEMRVFDRDRFEGGGRVRLYLTDDSARIPVRIETSLPVAGAIVLDLTQRLPGERL